MCVCVKERERDCVFVREKEMAELKILLTVIGLPDILPGERERESGCLCKGEGGSVCV